MQATTAPPRERPIIFSGSMVRAILEGRKTQTRRVVKNVPPGDTPVFDMWFSGRACPYGEPGDRLWARETWADVNTDSGPAIAYRADGDLRFCSDDAFPVEYERYPGGKFSMWSADLFAGHPGHAWRPSIHMPRWAARILLEVVSVRVERLNEINGLDALAEGLIDLGIPESRWHWDASAAEGFFAPWRAFRALWESINGEGSWKQNPFVWVVEFRRLPLESR